MTYRTFNSEVWFIIIHTILSGKLMKKFTVPVEKLHAFKAFDHKKYQQYETDGSFQGKAIDIERKTPKM